MIRLVVLVEGQSEEAFVAQVLAPHLNPRSVFTTAMIVETSRDRDAGRKYKGGGSSWALWRKDLLRLLGKDGSPALRVTTMFDLYRMPRDFPELEAHQRIVDTRVRIDALHAAMARDVGDRRLIPYVQRHEFEALVLAGLDRLDALLAPTEQRGVRKLRDEIAGIAPEDVDDGIETAPSRRLKKQIADYDKVLHGVGVVKRAGLPALRAACPRFDGWVTQLEALS